MLSIDFISLFNIAFALLFVIHLSQRNLGVLLTMFKLTALFLSLVALLCSTTAAFGQGTDLGTIRGSVTDTGGAVIPDALVSVTDSLTNSVLEAHTNSQGDYEIFGLNPGTYKVTISAPGMTKAETDNVILTGSDAVSINAVLKISSAQETVVVSMEAPTIDTEDQTISQTLNNIALIELPRDSRNIYTFLYLNPNVTQSSVDGSFKFIGAQSYGANFSLDGQRANGGIFGEPTQSQPSLEAVGEINVLTSDFGAEYAGIANIRVNTKRGGADFHGSLFYNNKNSALAAWTIDDKIGQAEFEPTAFQSKYPNPYFNITDFGGSFGGPVHPLKNTWFFAAYERNYNVSPAKISSSSIPHPSLYTGDFSDVLDSAKPLVPDSVTLTPEEISNNTVVVDGTLRFITIPSRLLNPTVQQIINTYYPKIGLGVPIDPRRGRILGGFQTILPGRSVQDLGTLRLDHDFSERNRLYGVYNVSAQTNATVAVVNPFTGLGLTQNDRRNNTLSLSYVHTFSTSIVNELRTGFNRQKLLRHSNTTLEGFLSSIGFDQSDIASYGSVVGPFALSTFGHPAILFSGGFFANFTNGGRNTFRPLDQNLITFGDTLTWIVGKHDFRMGGDLVRNAAVDGFALNRGNPRGSMTYGGSGTNPFTNFLLGLPPTSVTYVLQPRPAMDVHNWEHGYFFQDTWKVNSKLTVNLGLRYELVTPFIDKNDLIANFDPNFVNPTTGQLGRFVIPSEKTLKFLDTRIVDFGFAFASAYGLGRGTVFTDKLDFSPRIGIAYRIGDKSVVRGGYGIYYPTTAAQGIRDPIATNPFNQGITKRGNVIPLEGWPGETHGISPVAGGKISSGLANAPSVNVVPFDLKQPRIHQYNVTFEREFAWGSAIRFSYLGATMHGLIAGKDLNELQPSDVPFGTHSIDEDTGEPNGFCDPVDAQNCDFTVEDRQRYRFPSLGDFVINFGNYGHAQSNAFQTVFEHRYSHGLLLNIAYTYLDQKSTALDTGNSSLGGVTYNQFQPDSDYGIDGYISKHRLVAYGVYDLPVGRKHRFGSSMSGWADAIIGGWQTTFNMFAKSGTGFTPFWLCDDCTANNSPITPGNVGVSSIDAVGDFNNESFRPIVLSNNFNQGSGDRIWNPDAFGPPTVGADLFTHPGVAKRNMLWGPGTWGVNLGVHKNFHVTERVVAQLGADVDNLFNHPLLSPDADVGGGGGSFALLGSFNLRVDQTTGNLLPIAEEDITRNPDFGRLISTFRQEGVENRRTIRLRLRITF
jgi:hypothetical protein